MPNVDVELIEGLGLPYEPGTETNLSDSALDQVFSEAWQAFVALFPGQTLLPLFDELTVDELADLVDGVRVDGEEPPNPFVWFTLICDEAEVDALVTGLKALPMVVQAGRRPGTFLAGMISWGTNPVAGIGETRQIRPSPIGVDAIYGWQVAGGAGDGVRIVDIENGWQLDHPELITAQITSRSVFGVASADDIDHGTAVAGIVVGADNGVGSVGMVPNAALDLVTNIRANGIPDTANAIAWASRHLTRGDILLLEAAANFFALSDPNDAKPDILVEFDPAAQLQIRLAVGRGITVIEPAGNADNVDLDRFPFLAHTWPESPTFSGAIVVGSARDTAADEDPPSGNWARNSAFGRRVDCFAAGRMVIAPKADDPDHYQFFGGTSGASAIVAGLVASLQAMTKAASKDSAVLEPADVRRLMRNALLGTLPNDPLNAKIGTMPSLRKIVQAQGLHRILPVGAAAIGLDALLIVYLDADNRMVRRHFTLLTGWGPPVPTPTDDGSESAKDKFELTPAQPAVNFTNEVEPIPRLVYDAFFSGPGGIHHMWWDSSNQSGDVETPIITGTANAQGHAVAAVRPRPLLVALACVGRQGHLNIVTGDPQIPHSSMSPPMQLDDVAMYRRLSGPTMVSRNVGLADIVAIEDGGGLHWYSGTFDPAGMVFSGPVTEPSAVQFDPGARPALISAGNVLLAAAVGADGVLRVASIDPEAATLGVPVEVDASESIARSGPVALGLTASNVVVAGVDTQSVLRAATCPFVGGSWTPLEPLLSLVEISPLGGVTLVSLDLGVMAIAVGIDGVVQSALSADGIVWSPLLPLPADTGWLDR
jgi:hypothetical protein